jgi:DNA (cytosine-5)-methyltransferase 1
LRFGSLFSGIGGLDLGLERTGMTCAWQVEIDPYARRVLEKRWPDVRRCADVRTVHGAWGRGGCFWSGRSTCLDCLPSVDLICGGFPCQPFSTASRGRRVAADLWPEMLRVVRDVRPRFVLAENVSLSAIEASARDLADTGYACGLVHLPAAMVGAPHERPRWFVVADANGNSQPLLSQYAEVAGLSDLAGASAWAALPERLGVDYGIPHRMDRLRCLGNAVVPQVAEHVGRLILEAARA